jgi:hypothetical protein
MEAKIDKRIKGERIDKRIKNHDFFQKNSGLQPF